MAVSATAVAMSATCCECFQKPQAMEGWGTDETKLTNMICCKSHCPWVFFF